MTDHRRAVIYVNVPAEVRDGVKAAAERDGVSMALWVGSVLGEALKAGTSVRMVAQVVDPGDAERA